MQKKKKIRKGANTFSHHCIYSIYIYFFFHLLCKANLLNILSLLKIFKCLLKMYSLCLDSTGQMYCILVLNKNSLYYYYYYASHVNDS